MIFTDTIKKNKIIIYEFNIFLGCGMPTIESISTWVDSK
jgi:hypothetical protein